MPSIAAANDQPGYRMGTAPYRRMTVAMVAGGLANFSLLYFVQPLLPMLAEQYKISPAESANALSITTLALIGGLLMAGPLSDRFGRVAIMRWSLLLSGLFGLATAFAPNWDILLTLRAALGVTAAWLPAAALAYLREEVHPSSHGRANAAYIAGTAVGGAAGRLIPEPIAALGGWTSAALVMSLLTLASGAAMWLLLPEAHGFTPHRVDAKQMLLGTIRAPLDPVIALLSLAGFAALGTFVAVYNAMAFRLQDQPFALGHAAALVYLAYPVGIAAPHLLRRASDRIGRGSTTMLGSIALLVAILVSSVPTLPAVMVGLGLLTFAFLGVHSLLSGWVVARAARLGIGTAQASSAYLLSYYLGSTIAGSLATWQWQVNGWSAVEVLTFGLAGVAALAAGAASQVDRRTGFSPQGKAAHL